MRHTAPFLFALLVTAQAITQLPVRAQGVAPPRIAFTSDDDVYRIDVNGRNLRNLTESRARDGWPSWAPDGRKIAYVSRSRDDVPIGVFVMKANGADPQPVSRRPSEDSRPAWSPNGKSIAFVSNRDNWGWRGVFVMDADGANQRIVTGGTLFADVEPAWSPNGRMIAFSSSRDGNGEIYVVNEDGTGSRRITEHPAEDGTPTWSPAGRQIAFESSRDQVGLRATVWKEIYVVGLDGGPTRRITVTPNDGGSFDPAWSPDGSQIAFASYRGAPAQLFVMDPQGNEVRQITDGRSPAHTPAWHDPSVTLALSHAGKLLSTWGWIKGPW